MPTQDEEIARHIQQALDSGELQQTKGFGKPLVPDAGWEATPDSLRMPFKILKDGGFAPPEVALFHERVALRKALVECADEAQQRALAQQLSELEQRLSLRLAALRATGNL